MLFEERIIAHDELFEFVAGVDDDFLRIVVCHHILRETLAEGTGAPGDEYCFAVNYVCHENLQAAMGLMPMTPYFIIAVPCRVIAVTLRISADAAYSPHIPVQPLRLAKQSFAR